MAEAGIVRTLWCSAGLCCCEKAFLLVGLCDVRWEDYVLIMRMTLVIMMMMQEFLDSVGIFVLGASGQVDLGVSFVTLSVRSSSSSSPSCKIV